jgi:hypothetical protein
MVHMWMSVSCPSALSASGTANPVSTGTRGGGRSHVREDASFGQDMSSLLPPYRLCIRGRCDADVDDSSIVEGKGDLSTEECITTTKGLHCTTFESGRSVPTLTKPTAPVHLSSLLS